MCDYSKVWIHPLWPAFGEDGNFLAAGSDSPFHNQAP